MRTQRNSRTPIISKVRSMTETDVALLRQKSAAPQIQRLRESHHWVCYLLSTGLSYTEIAAKTGYSISRISVLANTPAVQEQVAVYRREILKPEIASEVDLLKAACGHKFYRHLHDHLCDSDDANELLPLRDCLAGIKTIYGNSGTTVSINVGFAARLEAAVATTRKLSKLVEHEDA
jgi:hypothetical protein